MVERFTEEQISEFKEIFSLFDKDGDGRIPIKELGTIVRSIMQNATKAQLEDIIKEADPDGQGFVDFIGFLKFPGRKMKDYDIEEELIKEFRVYDKDDQGKINFSKLKVVLIGLEENLTEEEIDQMIKLAKVDEDGNVNYKEFIKDLELID